MLKPRVEQKTGLGLGARVDAVPTVTYFILLFLLGVGRNNSVGIETGYGLDGPGIESRWGRDFPHLSRLTLGPTHPPVQWVPSLSQGKEQPGHDADPSPPSSAMVMKG